MSTIDDLRKAYRKFKQAHPDATFLFRSDGKYWFFEKDCRQICEVMGWQCVCNAMYFGAEFLDRVSLRLLKFGLRVFVVHDGQSEELEVWTVR